MKVFEQIRGLNVDEMTDFICRMKKAMFICPQQWACLRCAWGGQCRLWSADFIRRWLYKKYNDLDFKPQPKSFKTELDRIKNLDIDGLVDFMAGMKKLDYKCKKIGACEKCAWIGLCQVESAHDVKAWLEMPIDEAIEKQRELRAEEKERNKWRLI
ncbi:MAG: hypothetical protein IKW45_03700 [Clostridia bacterium]|nr:hypothetical protein [Clostridia bacterium]